MFTYKIEIGDWSKDGHNASEVIIFESSHSQDDLLEANKKLKKKRIDIKKICSEYEEDYIDAKLSNKFKKMGIDLDSFLDTHEENDDGKSYYVTNDDIFELLMHLLKTQIPTLTWEKVGDKIEEIVAFKGIGYGCLGY
jgi:hypothetical protein